MYQTEDADLDAQKHSLQQVRKAPAEGGGFKRGGFSIWIRPSYKGLPDSVRDIFKTFPKHSWKPHGLGTRGLPSLISWVDCIGALGQKREKQEVLGAQPQYTIRTRKVAGRIKYFLHVSNFM